MICPICKGDLLDRARCSSSYCEGYRDGRDETEWRALLERDVAEVERALDWLETLGRGADAIAGGYAAMRMWEQRAVDCRAWLARARAVLG